MGTGDCGIKRSDPVGLEGPVVPEISTMRLVLGTKLLVESWISIVQQTESTCYFGVLQGLVQAGTS